MYKKIPWATILLILVVAGVIILVFLPKTKLPETKITDTTLLGHIAREKGFFEEKKELKIKREIMKPEDSISALLAGEVDYTTFLGTFAKPHIETSLRGAPIKTIMLTTRHSGFSLIAQPELELNDLKTVGIEVRHTSKHYQALKFFEENNLEVEITTPKAGELFLTREELQGLLEDEKVDAILTMHSHTLRLQPLGFTVLATFIDVLPSGLVVRNDKIEKNPEEIKKIVRAFERTMEFIVTEPEKTKGLLLKVWDLEKTEENLETIEEIYSLMRIGHDRTDVPHDEGAELLIKIIKAGEFETLQDVEEQVVTQEELDKVFDFRFVR